MYYYGAMVHVYLATTLSVAVAASELAVQCSGYHAIRRRGKKMDDSKVFTSQVQRPWLQSEHHLFKYRAVGDKKYWSAGTASNCSGEIACGIINLHVPCVAALAHG